MLDKKRLIIYTVYMIDTELLNTPKCPKCGSVEGQMYAGFNRSGSRRCVCRKCNYKYTLNRKYSEEFKERAIQLYKAGNSAREVGRILNISKTSVYNWIREFEEDSKKI